MADWNTMWAGLRGTLGIHVLQLLGALLIVIVGWFLAALVKAGARKGLRLLRLNERFAGTSGQRADLEGAIALALFWLVMLLTLGAMFGALELSQVSGSFAALNLQLFEYAPRVLGAALLALLAWLVAALVRGLARKLLDRTTLDDKLSEHAHIAPISENLSNALFWLVVLLFVPAILGTLQMDGLLLPLRDMTARAVDILPDIVAAVVIGGVGWVVSMVLRNLTSNLLRSAGFDQLGSKLGLAAGVQLSRLAGLLVFVPALIAALDALRIEAISRPATDMLGVLLDAVPRIMAAGLILLLTWLVATLATRLLSSLLANLGLDTLPARLGLQQAFARTPPSQLIGRVGLLFAMLFAVVEASNQLGFQRLADLVTTFIEFAGDVLLGSLILIVGFMLANAAYEAISRASGRHTPLARLARLAILGIVLAMGLRAMGIADDIVNLAFGLTLGAIAVAVALAFGLGGREAAARLAAHWVDRWTREQAADEAAATPPPSPPPPPEPEPEPAPPGDRP